MQNSPVFIKEKYLLLDIGDTIVHTTEPFDIYTKRAIGYVYDVLNLSLDKEAFIEKLYQERTNIRKKAYQTLIEFTFQEFIKSGLQRFNIAISDEEADELEFVYVKAELEITELFDDTMTFLQKAKRNNKIIIAVTNNFSTLLVQELLKEFNLSPYFTAVCISGDFRIRKPHKDFLDTICSNQNIPKNDCVIIGDKLLRDVLSGKRSGVKTCLLNRNRDTAVNPVKHESPDITISNLSKIEF